MTGGKHAFLITAYTDPDAAMQLVGRLVNKRSAILVHWDRRSEVDPTVVLGSLVRNGTVRLVTRPVAVRWGGRSHLQAILNLLEDALAEPLVQRIHLLSGQCYLVRPLSDLFDHLDRHADLEYIEVFPLPAARWGRDGGFDRISTFQPFDLLDGKNPLVRKLIRGAARGQRMIGLTRSYPLFLPKLHGGSTWWSLSRDCVEWLMNRHRADPSFFNRLAATFCPEEMYFQSMVMNSPFVEKLQFTNLHYIDWSLRNGSWPAFLDLSDLDKIIDSGKYFARKFSSSVSRSLIDGLLAKGLA